MNPQNNRELKHIITSSYDGIENIDELLAFYNLSQKFRLSTIKEIYPESLFTKYYEILKSISLITDSKVEFSEMDTDKLEKLFSINTEWLRYYVNLVETKNLRLTAKNLNITPAALSKAITGIEENLQVILLERDKNFGKLTFIGDILYERSKEILQNLYQVNSAFDEIKSGEPHGEINIAWFLSWGKDIITKTVESFIEKYPKVYIKINYVSGIQVEKSVSEGIFDIGFMPQKPVNEDIYISDIIDIDYAIIGSPQPFKNWDEFSYIIKSNSLERFAHSNILSSWPEKEFKRNIISECNSAAGIIEFCKSGLGVAFMPVSLVADELRDGTLCVVADLPFKYKNKLYIVYHKELYFTSASYLFLKELKKNIKSGIKN